MSSAITLIYNIPFTSGTSLMEALHPSRHARSYFSRMLPSSDEDIDEEMIFCSSNIACRQDVGLGAPAFRKAPTVHVERKRTNKKDDLNKAGVCTIVPSNDRTPNDQQDMSRYFLFRDGRYLLSLLAAVLALYSSCTYLFFGLISLLLSVR